MDFQQKQEERRRARQRARRIQQTKQIALLVGGLVVIGLLIWGAFAVLSPKPTTKQPNVHPSTGTQTHPAVGQVVDGLSCVSSEGNVQHYHLDVQIFVNGQQQQLPEGVGIVSNTCLYPLHTHDTTGIIHIESPDNSIYVLGNLFDLWGQPLNQKQFGSNAVDSAHKLVVKVFDANGKLTTYTGDPARLQLAAHQTVVLLYNSPNVTPSPYTQWNGL